MLTGQGKPRLQSQFTALGVGLAALALGLTSTPALAGQDALADQETQPSQQAPTSGRPSAASVLANLETASPIDLVYVVAEEWNSGNRLRATFWYYVWQIRTDAWVAGYKDSSFKTVRAILSDQMGASINVWITADPALMRDTAERAIAYEAKLPLSVQHPEDVTPAEWPAIVAKSRADYAAELREAFADISDEEILATRTQNGLPVGTPTDQGAPLPDDWR